MIYVIRIVILVLMHLTIPGLSNGFEAPFSSANLCFPVISRGPLGTGAGISRTNVQDSGNVLYQKEDQVFRFLNNVNQYFLFFYEGLETVEVLYLFDTKEYRKVTKLKFNRRLFLQAFDGAQKSGKINYSQISKSLIQSISGVELLARQKYLSINDENRDGHLDNVGSKYVICSYADSNPMFAFHTHIRNSWSPHCDGIALRRMRNWGITDRLQKLRIDRVSEMPNGPSNRHTALHGSRIRTYYPQERRTGSLKRLTFIPEKVSLIAQSAMGWNMPRLVLLILQMYHIHQGYPLFGTVSR